MCDEIYMPFTESVLAGRQLRKGLIRGRGPFRTSSPPGFMARARFDLGQPLEAADPAEHRWAEKSVAKKGVPTITWKASVKGGPGSWTSISAWDGDQELVRARYDDGGDLVEVCVMSELDERCGRGMAHASFYKALRSHFIDFKLHPVPKRSKM